MTLLSSLNRKIKRAAFAALLLFFISPIFGQGWTAMPFSIDRSPHIFFEDTKSGNLHVGGNMRELDTHKIWSYFVWDGTTYTNLPKTEPRADPPKYFGYFNDTLYMAGGHGIYKFVNSKWNSFETTGSLAIHELDTFNQSLLAVGISDSLGAISILNGSKFKPFKGVDSILGRDAWVNAVEQFQGEYYFGGNINWSDIKKGNYKEILRWTGTKWLDVGGGLKGDCWINDMAVYKNELYVAGYFFRAAGNADNHIMRWNGNEWKPVGGGVEGYGIHSLEVIDDYLWAVGNFSKAGGVSVSNIARWNGKEWCGLKTVFNEPIVEIGTYKNELYIGGGFRHIGGDTNKAIMAKWTGNFQFENCGAIDYTSVENKVESEQFIKIYPNPVSSKLTIHSEKLVLESIRIFDINGHLVRSFNLVGQPTFSETIDVESLPNGVYSVVVKSETEIYSSRFIKIEEESLLLTAPK